LSASEEERVSSNSKKKKKSRVIRENDLSNEEKTKAEVIAGLHEKYKCNMHQTACFIQENRHLQLNPARIQIWAREIVSNFDLLIYFLILFLIFLLYNYR
jgi:hypothetical protein